MNEGFLLSDATAAECRWPAQNDGEETEGKLSSTVMRRLVEINSQIHKRQHLFPELVGRSCSASASSQNVFLFQEKVEGGSGFSPPLS